MGFRVELKAGGGSGELLGNFKRVVGQLAKQNPQLEIGFPEGSTYPDGKSVAYIAYIQNVGLGGVPERPFMQKTVEEKSKDWLGFLENSFKGHIIEQDIFVRALRALGPSARTDLQMTIRNWPPGEPRLNKPATIAAKRRKMKNGKSLGVSNPERALIDTSTMINAVSWQIANEK